MISKCLPVSFERAYMNSRNDVNNLRPSNAYIIICVSKLGHHWFRLWFVDCPVPSHYMIQCWDIVNWTLWNTLQWNLNQNLSILTHEKAFESVVWKMAATLSHPGCVTVALITHQRRHWNYSYCQIIDRSTRIDIQSHTSVNPRQHHGNLAPGLFVACYTRLYMIGWMLTGELIFVPRQHYPVKICWRYEM